MSFHLIPSLTISPLTICTFPSNGTASDHVYPMLPLISSHLMLSHLISCHLIPSLTISPLTICTFLSNGTASEAVEQSRREVAEAHPNQPAPVNVSNNLPGKLINLIMQHVRANTVQWNHVQCYGPIDITDSQTRERFLCIDI